MGEKMKKILILANKDITLLYFRKELIEKLVAEKNEVTVCFPKSDKVEVFTKIGCKYIDIKMDRRGMNPIKDIGVIFNYSKILKEIKPDIVLTFTIKPNLYGGIACRFRNVPYIANITGLGTALQNKGILQKFTVFLYHIAFEKIKCCFLQNEDNMKFFEKHNIAEGKRHLLPGSGVNLEKYKLLEYPKEDNLEFIFVGRIMKEKGIDLYIETAKYIKSKYKNAKFHVIGYCEQDYEQKLKNLQNQGIIIYHGKQDDMIPFYKLSCCTIHPTYYPEGMSNVLLESAASGRPVITTDKPGCREIVDNGVTGFIVKPEDLEDLKEKVELFINKAYEEKINMGLAGRKKVEKEFDRNIVIKKYIDEINNIN